MTNTTVRNLTFTMDGITQNYTVVFVSKANDKDAYKRSKINAIRQSENNAQLRGLITEIVRDAYSCVNVEGKQIFGPDDLDAFMASKLGRYFVTKMTNKGTANAIKLLMAIHR